MSKPEQNLIFEQWFAQHKALFFKIVRSYALTPMDQDDLFQEIIIQVWYSIPSWEHKIYQVKKQELEKL